MFGDVEDGNAEGDGNGPGRFTLPPQQIRSEAVLEAGMLLEYAAEHGFDFDIGIAKTIADAKMAEESPSADDGSKWTSEKEAEFWGAYRTLARTIAPVTIDSLRATSAVFGSRPWLSRITGRGRRVSKAALAARRFANWGLVTLIALLLFQGYWVYVSTALAQYDASVARIEKIRGDRESYRSKYPAADDTNPNLLGYDAQLAALQKAYESSLATLDKVNLGKSLLSSDETGSEQSSSANYVLRFNVEFLQRMLALYILPLLYGFIGATAYVLRSVSDEIRSLSYTDASLVNYQLRRFLGALSGLVIGLFLTTASSTGAGAGDGGAGTVSLGGISITQISPFALAFVAGYSVELLFSLMDRIVKAFVTREPQPPAAGGRTGGGKL